MRQRQQHARRRRLRHAGWLAALASIWIVVGCSDPAMLEGQREIAAELRAVRATLRSEADQGTRRATSAERPDPAADRAAMTAALEPLREVLVALVRDVDEVRSRQQALTGELKRWSQLLAQVAARGPATGTSGEGAPDAAAIEQLLSRLGELEQQIQAQDTRHREVEGMIATALDRTSSRLEDFLDRINGLRQSGAAPPPATGDPAAGPGGKSGEPGNAENRGSNPGTSEGGSDPGGSEGAGGGKDQDIDAADPGGAVDAEDQKVTSDTSAPADDGTRASVGDPLSYRGRRSPTFWWFGVAAVALILTGVFALWLARENRAATSHAGADPDAGNDGSKELWAAAALLGEAVGRLKDRDSEEGDGGDGTTGPEGAAAFDPTADPMALFQQLAGGGDPANAGPAAQLVADAHGVGDAPEDAVPPRERPAGTEPTDELLFEPMLPTPDLAFDPAAVAPHPHDPLAVDDPTFVSPELAPPPAGLHDGDRPAAAPPDPAPPDPAVVDSTGRDPADVNRTADGPAAGEPAAAESAVGELATGELATGELAAGELAAGELATGGLAAGDPQLRDSHVAGSKAEHSAVRNPALGDSAFGDSALGDGHTPRRAVPDPVGPPPIVELLVPAADPASSAPRTAAALAGEARVLRRPAPECVPREHAVLVRYHLLPGTLASESSRIEGRVRIAAR